MSRLEDLTKLRDDLLIWMADAPVDRKAALVAQFRATIQEIEGLSPKESTGDGINEIAARRSARRSSSADPHDNFDDPVIWAKANPSYGVRISHEACAAFDEPARGSDQAP